MSDLAVDNHESPGVFGACLKASNADNTFKKVITFIYRQGAIKSVLVLSLCHTGICRCKLASGFYSTMEDSSGQKFVQAVLVML